MPARHDGSEVLHEDDGVQRISTEATTDEECASLAQKPSDDREIQVDAGGYVRNCISVHIDRIRQQQVVHVAAVARNINDFVALRGLLQRFNVTKHDSVVESIP